MILQRDETAKLNIKHLTTKFYYTLANIEDSIQPLLAIIQDVLTQGQHVNDEIINFTTGAMHYIDTWLHELRTENEKKSFLTTMYKSYLAASIDEMEYLSEFITVRKAKVRELLGEYPYEEKVE